MLFIICFIKIFKPRKNNIFMLYSDTYPFQCFKVIKIVGMCSESGLLCTAERGNNG